jgi:hypothetical protein
MGQSEGEQDTTTRSPSVLWQPTNKIYLRYFASIIPTMIQNDMVQTSIPNQTSVLAMFIVLGVSWHR